MSRKQDLQRILNRGTNKAGCLDRLTDYSQDIIRVPFNYGVCGSCNPEEDDACDDCGGYEIQVQLEYELQTRVIEFSEELIESWIKTNKE